MYVFYQFAAKLCDVNAGFSHILTMDLHQKEVQGFFNCPIDNLRASNFLIEFITQSVSLINCFTSVISWFSTMSHM